MLKKVVLPPFTAELLLSIMAAGDAAEQPAAASTKLPIRSNSSIDSFDIVSKYQSLLASDPNLTKPLAAIEALIALLGALDSTTVFETLDTVKRHSDTLIGSVANPVPLTAGTDLFQRYLLSWLRQSQESNGSGSGSGGGDLEHNSFDEVRQHLVRNTRVFAARALDARDRIAEHGWRFVRDDEAVLTHGASRAVLGLLARAAAESRKMHAAVDGDDAPARFRVIYVRDDMHVPESDSVVAELRAHRIPVAEISQAAVAQVMELLRAVDRVIVGAEAVTQNGGIISRTGTLQIARLAEQRRIPVCVAAETHKFVRKFPLDQQDLGFTQTVLDFRVDGPSRQPQDAVDYTPPQYISHIVTENGVKLPNYVFEALLEIHGSLAGTI